VKSNRSDRGLALVFVLWTLVILMTVTGGAAVSVRQSLVAERIYYENLRSEWLARAGIERAAAFLAEDDDDVDSASDTWANDEEEEFAKAELGEGGFEVVRDAYDDEGEIRYGFIDEASKLNVNTATYDQLMEIPGMTEEIADSIIDWRDSDSETRANGAETEHYEVLEPPYEPKNAPIESIRELLLINGVETDIFFGEDTNGNGILDDNEDDEDETAPGDNGDGVLDRGLAAYLTASSFERNKDADGNERVNITSADENSLKGAGFSSDEAKAIVEYRKSKKFTSIADLLEVTKPAQKTRGGRTVVSKKSQSNNKAVSEARLMEAADKLTLSDEEILKGKVNINTASEAVLKAVFLDETIAAAVHDYAVGDQGPFKNAAELLNVDGISSENLKDYINYVMVRSNVFCVRSTGYIGEDEQRVTTTVEAFLIREDKEVKVVNVRLAQ